MAKKAKAAVDILDELGALADGGAPKITPDAIEKPMDRDYRELITDLEYRLWGLKTTRSNYQTVWADLADYVSPSLGAHIQRKDQNQQGFLKASKILDNTAFEKLRTLAAGMLGGMSSPTKPWFRLAMPDMIQDDNSVKVWLSDVEQRIRAVMDGGKFYEALTLAYMDLGLFGTAAMLIYADEKTTISCRPLPVGQYYFEADDKGEITGLYREMSLTLYQLVRAYGVEALPAQLQLDYESKRGFDISYTVFQAIQPNKDFNPYVKGKDLNEYSDIHWLDGRHEGRLLSYKGFREKPFCAPRWHVPAGGSYGTSSPAWEALADIKQLQDTTAFKLQAVAKNISPPLIAHEMFKNQPAAFMPKGIMFSGNLNEIYAKPLYEARIDITPLQMDIQDLRQRINQVFFGDLWLLLANMEGIQPRSNLEIIERKGEKILQLSPIVQKIQSELLKPAIERIFLILHREGKLPPMPPAIQQMSGEEIKIEYVNELAVAQNAKDTVPIEQFVAFLGNMAAARPDVLDKLNGDEAIDLYSRALGVNPKMVVDTDEANAVRDARAQQQQQMAMMQQGLAAAQGAKTLSETEVGGGVNALSRMMGVA